MGITRNRGEIAQLMGLLLKEMACDALEELGYHAMADSLWSHRAKGQGELGSFRAVLDWLDVHKEDTYGKTLELRAMVESKQAGRPYELVSCVSLGQIHQEISKFANHPSFVNASFWICPEGNINAGTFITTTVGSAVVGERGKTQDLSLSDVRMRIRRTNISGVDGEHGILAEFGDAAILRSNKAPRDGARPTNFDSGFTQICFSSPAVLDGYEPCQGHVVNVLVLTDFCESQRCAILFRAKLELYQDGHSITLNRGSDQEVVYEIDWTCLTVS